MVPRDGHRTALERLLSRVPVVALLGARQVGKTTLAREIARRRTGPTHVFDLESSADVARLADPLLTLAPLRGLVVVDEVQRRPDLFPSLRVLADRPRRPARGAPTAGEGACVRCDMLSFPRAPVAQPRAGC